MTTQTTQQNQITTRSSISFNLQSFREADDSVEFVLATEEPSEVWDWGRCDIVKESLVASGVNLPKNNQIPLLDSHNRDGIKNILGSVREFRIENGQVIGRLFFSKKKEAQEALQMIREGHLDSGSVGYSQTDSVWIEEGNSLIHEGRSYQGPLLLTRSWNLKEYSLVAIGADPNAKAREDVSDSLKAVNNKKLEGENNLMANESKTIEQPAVDVAEIERKAIEAERTRVSAIRAVCEKHNCRDLVDTLINGGYTIDAANSAVLDELAKRSVPVANATSTISLVADEKDKFIDAATDGMLMRAGLVVDKPAAGAEEFKDYGYENLARKVLNRAGHNQIHGKIETLNMVMRAGAMGYDDFANILDNGVRKAVRIGYNSAPSTWKAWATKGSLDNLEPTMRTGLTDIPEPALYKEGAEIEYTTIGDEGEKVKLDTYANKIVLTRRAILADNMNLFSQISRIIGRRCAQKAESLAYSVLTGNANMSDNVALFHNSHRNLLGGGVLSKENLGKAYALMMKQVDANGSKLALTPRFLLVSPDDAELANILTTSQNDVGSIALGNTNYFRNNGLVAISSPYLSQSDGFFLVCDPADGASVEVDFLDGIEGPTIEISDNDKDILSRSWKYYFDVGAKAIDFRGLNKTPYSA